MKKITPGHYRSVEGFDVYLIKKRECTDKVRKSGKTFAEYRTVRFWNARIHDTNQLAQGLGTKAQAIAAAHKILKQNAIERELASYSDFMNQII